MSPEKIQHVNNKIDPVEDLETIKTEIHLSDIETIQKKLEKSKKKLLSQKEIDTLEKSLDTLNLGKDLNTLEILKLLFLSQIGLLSLKPKIIVCNVDEENFNKGNEHTKKIEKKISERKDYHNMC